MTEIVELILSFPHWHSRSFHLQYRVALPIFSITILDLSDHSIYNNHDYLLGIYDPLQAYLPLQPEISWDLFHWHYLILLWITRHFYAADAAAMVDHGKKICDISSSDDPDSSLLTHFVGNGSPLLLCSSRINAFIPSSDDQPHTFPFIFHWQKNLLWHLNYQYQSPALIVHWSSIITNHSKWYSPTSSFFLWSIRVVYGAFLCLCTSFLHYSIVRSFVEFYFTLCLHRIAHIINFPSESSSSMESHLISILSRRCVIAYNQFPISQPIILTCITFNLKWCYSTSSLFLWSSISCSRFHVAAHNQCPITIAGASWSPVVIDKVSPNCTLLSHLTYGLLTGCEWRGCACFVAVRLLLHVATHPHFRHPPEPHTWFQPHLTWVSDLRHCQLQPLPARWDCCFGCFLVCI